MASLHLFRDLFGLLKLECMFLICLSNYHGSFMSVVMKELSNDVEVSLLMFFSLIVSKLVAKFVAMCFLISICFEYH